MIYHKDIIHPCVTNRSLILIKITKMPFNVKLQILILWYVNLDNLVIQYIHIRNLFNTNKQTNKQCLRKNKKLGIQM